MPWPSGSKGPNGEAPPATSWRRCTAARCTSNTASSPPRGTALAAIAGSAIAGYVLVFVDTHAELAWHLPTAAARTVAHVVPLCGSASPSR